MRGAGKRGGTETALRHFGTSAPRRTIESKSLLRARRITAPSRLPPSSKALFMSSAARGSSRGAGQSHGRPSVNQRKLLPAASLISRVSAALFRRKNLSFLGFHGPGPRNRIYELDQPEVGNKVLTTGVHLTSSK